MFLNCFKISSVRTDWTLCSEDLLDTSEFREHLILNMVVAGGYEKLSEVATTKDPIVFSPEYTWTDQSSWKGVCKSGTA